MTGKSFRDCFLKCSAIMIMFFAVFGTKSVFAADAPGNLRVNSVSDRAVSLTWNTVPQPLNHIAIYCNGDKVKEVYVNGTDNSGYRGAVIRDLEPDTTYTLSAKAVYANGEESGFSNTVEVTTKPDSKKNIGQNFAMDAQITASSSANELLWPKDCVVDGTDAWLNVRNQWLSQWGKGENAWLTLDFGEVRYVGKWVVKHIGVTGQTYNTVDFDLLVSDDGENWTTVKEYRGNSEKITEFEPEVPIKGRYFKFLCIKPAEAPDGVYARVSEIELYSAIGTLDIEAKTNIAALGVNDKIGDLEVKVLMSNETEKRISENFTLESSNGEVLSVDGGEIVGVGKGTADLIVKYSETGNDMEFSIPITVCEITVSSIRFENSGGNVLSSLNGESRVCAKAVVSNKSGENKNVMVLIAYYDQNGKMVDVAVSGIGDEIENGAENISVETGEINVSGNGGEAVIYLWKGFGGSGRYIDCIKISH